MRTKILIFALMLTGLMSNAQQDAQYTHYMYNTINVNPAYAGSRGVLSIFGLHRTQWVGLDGAPVTNAASAHMPIGDTNLGVGLSFVNDRIGPTAEYMASIDVSYTIQTSEDYKLSFGVKGTANIFEFYRNQVNPESQNDPLLQNLRNEFSPNIGAGVYFHSEEMYVGVSVPGLFETNRYDDNSISLSKERTSYYVIGGYVFDLSTNLKFKPAFLTKITEGTPLQLDVSANFLLFEKLVLGAAWRWDAAASFMTGFQITEGLYIGYGYDLETTKLRKYNSGSHEIFLRFEFLTRGNRIISPRFF